MSTALAKAVNGIRTFSPHAGHFPLRPPASGGTFKILPQARQPIQIIFPTFTTIAGDTDVHRVQV
ncbi:MAG: hypothetical protein ACK5UD_14935, partial [Planctomyces sp.]